MSNHRGSKTILNQELISNICDSVGKGNYIDTACQALGISDRTYRRWAVKGKRDTDKGVETIYGDFLSAVKKAHSEAEEMLLEEIKSANSPYWQARAWILERTRPDKYGRFTRLEHAGTVNVRPMLPVSYPGLEDSSEIAKPGGKKRLVEGRTGDNVT